MSAWDFDVDAYNEGWTLREKLSFWLQFAALAPSAHNNQPWDVAILEDGIIVRPNLELATAGIPRLTTVSLGAFVENFACAAEHFGFAVHMGKIPLSVPLSQLEIPLTVTWAGAKSDNPAFTGMTKRHTNRGLYQPEPLAETTLKTLGDMPREENVTLHFIDSVEDKEQIAEMAGRGLRTAVTMPGLRRELARFVKWEKEDSTVGMLVKAMVKNPVPSETGEQFILNGIDIPGEARFAYEKFRSTPLIVVVSTPQDDMPSWLAVGRTVQRFLNLAASLGLAHCIAAAPTEIPPFVPRMKRLLATEGRPQLTFRIGFPQDPSFTHQSPRRTVSSIAGE